VAIARWVSNGSSPCPPCRWLSRVEGDRVGSAASFRDVALRWGRCSGRGAVDRSSCPLGAAVSAPSASRRFAFAARTASVEEANVALAARGREIRDHAATAIRWAESSRCEAHREGAERRQHEHDPKTLENSVSVHAGGSKGLSSRTRLTGSQITVLFDLAGYSISSGSRRRSSCESGAARSSSILCRDSR